MFRQSHLVSFVHSGSIYPGQVSGYYPTSRTVYIFCIAPGSTNQGKEYLRYQDNVKLILKAEDFLLLGIDRNTKIPYDLRDKTQLAELDRVEEIARATNFETLQAARLEKFWQARQEEQKSIARAERQKRLKQMIFNKSELPVSQRGRSGGLTVSVRENGQIAFSTEAAKAFEGIANCTIGWEEDGDRVMTFASANPAKPPKGMKADEWAKSLFEISSSKDGSQRYINSTGILKAVEYDYKVAGTQNFAATISEVKEGAKVVGHKLSFELPAEVTPHVKTPRKPKTAAVAATAAAAATNGSPNPVPVTAKTLEPELAAN